MTDHRFTTEHARTTILFLLLTVGGINLAAAAYTPTPEDALSLEPVQANVDFDEVSEEVAAKCTVRDLEHAKWSGWEVVAPDGTLLRRFADTNADKKIDLWSYFKFGVEVYRDIDADFNQKADQYRWLGTAGTRWGLDDDEDGKVDRWRQISAEEVSAELVAAVREQDTDRFARLVATESELKKIGLGADREAELITKADRAVRRFTDLAKRQQAIKSDAQWVQFAATQPGIVPAETGGSSKDILVYENAVAMFEQSSGSGQLMVGTLVQIGSNWRLIELPALNDGSEGLAQTTGIFFTPGGAGMSVAGASIGAAAQEMLASLEELDNKLAAAGEPKEVAALHDERAKMIEKLATDAADAEKRETWVRQLVDTLSVAVQSGEYPQGLSRLKKISSQFGKNNERISSYAEFHAIGAEYAVRQTPDADFGKVQEWHLDQLARFVDRFPTTPESAEALLQMALSKEFEDKERDALGYYKQVAKSFSGTAAANKAAGAVRRLESVGKTIDLKSETIDGKSFELSEMRGAPVVLHYWATWCDPCKQDIKLLRRMQARYQKAGLQLVGVNVDNNRSLAEAYLKENDLPWIQLYEEGGLESGPAQSFGVQTLPTTMLIDSRGKVIRHNIRVREELDEELEAMAKGKR